MPVAFLYDYASPWAYLADRLLERELPGIEIEHRPIYIRGLDAFSSGVPFSPPKMTYLVRDLERCARHHGIELAVPSIFPVNGLQALRGALAARELGGFEAFHGPMFRAAWAEDRDASDRGVVLDVAVEAGLDRAAMEAHMVDPALKARLKEDTAAAQEAGVFGVPSFLVGEELFWGHDRLAYVRRAANGQ